MQCGNKQLPEREIHDAAEQEAQLPSVGGVQCHQITGDDYVYIVHKAALARPFSFNPDDAEK